MEVKAYLDLLAKDFAGVDKGFTYGVSMRKRIVDEV